MKLQKHWFRNTLFILIAFMAAFFFVFALKAPAMNTLVPVTFENCAPGTWVGGVRWLDNKTDYEDVPKLELKSTGSITILLAPGEYAITHYRPKFSMLDSAGNIVWFPSAILEFKEIEVGVLPRTYSFGCEE